MVFIPKPQLLYTLAPLLLLSGLLLLDLKYEALLVAVLLKPFQHPCHLPLPQTEKLSLCIA